jgi:hypothetical protein
VQLVLLGGGFSGVDIAASQGTASGHAENIQLHNSNTSVYFLLNLVGVVLRYLGWSVGGTTFRNRIGRVATDQRSTTRTISPITTQYLLHNTPRSGTPVINPLS